MGCFQHFSGSGCSQYSSSQSIGKSRSKLGVMTRHIELDACICQRTLHLESHTVDLMQHSHFDRYMSAPLKQLILRSIAVQQRTYQNALFHNSSSTDIDSAILRLRCAPTSCANLMPTPTIAQQAWGADEPCKNNTESYRNVSWKSRLQVIVLSE